MKKWFLIPLVILSGCLFTLGDEPPKVPKVEVPKLTAEQIPTHLQNVSVTIHADSSQGSGVVKVRDGVTYILTCAHVLETLKRTPKPNIVTFDDAKVVKEIYEDGRSVGYIALNAEVIRYSDAEHGEDLALLRVRKRNVFKHSTTFCTDPEPLPIGQKVFHVGSLLGQQGSNSLTNGLVSQYGRVRNDTVFDQTSAPAYPGSSGGGLFRESDGQYVGMIVRSAGVGFQLYVPMRRLMGWAERAGVDFILDDSIEVPEEKVLNTTPFKNLTVDDTKLLSMPKKKAVEDFDKKFPLIPYKIEE
jgi:hypothetical protein